MTEWDDPILDSVSPAIDRLFEDQKRVAVEMALVIREAADQPLNEDQQKRLAALKEEWAAIPRKIVELVKLAAKLPSGRRDH